MSLLNRFVQPFEDLVRWGEPWDVEEHDPLIDASPSSGSDHVSLWA